MAFFYQKIFFFCILAAEFSERKLNKSHFKRTEVPQTEVELSQLGSNLRQCPTIHFCLL